MNEHELFAAALEIDAPAERSAYLDRACGGDDAMRARVEALLRAHQQAGSFLQASPLAGSVTLDVAKPPAPSSGRTSCLSRSAKGAWARSGWRSRPSR